MTESQMRLEQISEVKIDSGQILIVDPVNGQDGATLKMPNGDGIYPVYKLTLDDGTTFYAIPTCRVGPETGKPFHMAHLFEKADESAGDSPADTIDPMGDKQ